MTNIYDVTINYIPSNITTPDCPDGECRDAECARTALNKLNASMEDALNDASDAYNAALAAKTASEASDAQAYIDCLNQPGDLFDFLESCMAADHDRREATDEAYRVAKAAVAAQFSADVGAAKAKYLADMAECCEPCEE